MKQITKQLFFIFTFLTNVSLFAQEATSLVTINNIVFVGNDKTNTAFLEQIISCQKDTEVNLSLIEKDIDQLKNLPSVASASYKLETTGENTTLTYEIEERITKLPILNFGGIKENIWFGLGLVENNFAGRGNLLLGYYQNTDGRHTAEVFYRNPRNLTGKWGYSFSLRKWSSIEPLYFSEGPVQYLYDNNSLSFSVIKNFGLQRNIELGGTIFRESYEQGKEQNLSSPPGPRNFVTEKFLSKFQINQNKLFQSDFYLDGHSINIALQNVYTFADQSFFNSIEIEGKYFLRPSPIINIATRLKFAVSTNNDSPFAPFVADSHVNIRGIGNRIDRGTAQTVLNLELRITGLQKGSYGSQFVFFSDLGTWRNPGGELNDLLDSSNFRHFVGGGVRLIYQKVFGATIRIDYSFDIYNTQERGFVFGLGQYF